MMAQTVSKFPMIWLTCLGLVLFFGVFLSVLIWINRSNSAAFYQALGQLPLEAPEGADSDSPARADSERKNAS